MNQDERQSIYNIYRACRLCGAGAGYKMPIIQSVIDVDGEGTELKLKIKECVRIEVSLNDRMPPLICELCVDKINDFFEFRLMCQENNRKTRLKLGLPPQPVPREVEPTSHHYSATGQSDPVASIVPKCEPFYIKSDSEESEPYKQSGRSKPKPKSAKKKETDINIKITNYQFPKQARSPSPERRDTRHKRGRSPSAPAGSKEDIALNQLQRLQKRASLPAPKSMKRRETEKLTENLENALEDDDNSLLLPRLKRSRDVPLEMPLPAKKAKSSEPVKQPRPGPKSSKIATMPPPPQKPPPKAGPKSRKREFTPTPAPNSKNRENSTALILTKSRSREVSPAVTSKGTRREVLPAAASKSDSLAAKAKKQEESPLPAPKTRQSENSSANLRSKKHEPSPRPKKIEEAKVSPANKFRCSNCVFKAKNAQGLASHLKTHSPSPKVNAMEARLEPPPQPPRAPSPAPRFVSCDICGHKAKGQQASTAHLKTHAPLFTEAKLACNPCQVWFSTTDEALWHHRRHTNKSLPYTCSMCYDDFRTTEDFELHLIRNQCLPTYEVPDVKCDECWRYFATYKLLEDHRCPGEGGRPGGNCSKCDRTYALMKHLMAHEIKCNPKKKDKVTERGKNQKGPLIDPEVSSRLLPMQVRIVRCDTLLENTSETRVDVTGLCHRFGLDRKCTYPYLNTTDDVHVKDEPTNYDTMVAINDDIKKEYLIQDDTYVHWDSEGTDDSDIDDNLFVKNKSADSLSALSLKTIFSPKCLGKVPKKKRRIKSEKMLDSVNLEIKTKIDKMIDDLDDESQNSYSLLRKGNEVDDSPSLNLFDSLKTHTENEIEISEIANGNIDKESDTSIDNTSNRETNKEDQNITKVENQDSNQIINSSKSDATNDIITESTTLVTTNDNESSNSEVDNLNQISNENNDNKNGLMDIIHKESNEEDDDNSSKSENNEKIDHKELRDEENNEEIKPKDEFVANEYISLANNHVITDESQSSDVSFKHVDDINNKNEKSNDISKIDTNLGAENDSADTVVKTEADIDTGSNSMDSVLISSEILDKSVASADKFYTYDLNEEDKRLMAEIDAQIGDTNDEVGENGMETDVPNDLIGEVKVISDSTSKVLSESDSVTVSDSKKLSLEDLIPKQSEELSSLDLESISDEEFNFNI